MGADVSRKVDLGYLSMGCTREVTNEEIQAVKNAISVVEGLICSEAALAAYIFIYGVQGAIQRLKEEVELRKRAYHIDPCSHTSQIERIICKFAASQRDALANSLGANNLVSSDISSSPLNGDNSSTNRPRVSDVFKANLDNLNQVSSRAVPAERPEKNLKSAFTKQVNDNQSSNGSNRSSKFRFNNMLRDQKPNEWIDIVGVEGRARRTGKNAIELVCVVGSAPTSGRQGTENVIPRGGKAGMVNVDRAHVGGNGLQIETEVGVLYAPAEFNKSTQRAFMEEALTLFNEAITKEPPEELIKKFNEAITKEPSDGLIKMLNNAMTKEPPEKLIKKFDEAITKEPSDGLIKKFHDVTSKEPPEEWNKKFNEAMAKESPEELIKIFNVVSPTPKFKTALRAEVESDNKNRLTSISYTVFVCHEDADPLDTKQRLGELFLWKARLEWPSHKNADGLIDGKDDKKVIELGNGLSQMQLLLGDDYDIGDSTLKRLEKRKQEEEKSKNRQ